jgi:hypothetical protein
MGSVAKKKAMATIVAFFLGVLQKKKGDTSRRHLLLSTSFGAGVL